VRRGSEGYYRESSVELLTGGVSGDCATALTGSGRCCLRGNLEVRQITRVGPVSKVNDLRPICSVFTLNLIQNRVQLLHLF